MHSRECWYGSSSLVCIPQRIVFWFSGSIFSAISNMIMYETCCNNIEADTSLQYFSRSLSLLTYKLQVFILVIISHWACEDVYDVTCSFGSTQAQSHKVTCTRDPGFATKVTWTRFVCGNLYQITCMEFFHEIIILFHRKLITSKFFKLFGRLKLVEWGSCENQILHFCVV